MKREIGLGDAASRLWGPGAASPSAFMVGCGRSSGRQGPVLTSFGRPSGRFARPKLVEPGSLTPLAIQRPARTSPVLLRRRFARCVGGFRPSVAETTSDGVGGVWFWDDRGVSRRDELVELMSELDAEPAVALKVMVRLQALVDEELLVQVGRARKAAMAWADIGNALGVTAQAAHKRFAWMV